MHLEKCYIGCMPFCYSSTCVRIPKYPSNVTASCLEQEERERQRYNYTVNASINWKIMKIHATHCRGEEWNVKI